MMRCYRPMEPDIFLRLATIFFLLSLGVASARSDEVERSISSEGIEWFTIQTTKGNFRLQAWDRPELFVKVFGKGLKDDKGIALDRKGSKAELKLSLNISIDECFILLPESINTEIKLLNGNILVSGFKGEQKIETVSGNIELKGVVGSVSAKTISGNIIADIRFDAPSDFSSTSGQIKVFVRDNFSVPITINTFSGPIDIFLPEGYPADIEAVSSSGNIRCELPTDISSMEGQSAKGRFSGKIYGGGPPLRLTSFSGEINIRLAVPPSPNIGGRRRMPRPGEVPPMPVMRKVISVTRTLDPPKIDGRLDDDCWRKASKINDFIWGDGISRPQETTKVYLLWDERNLYIGAICNESSMETIRISATEKDSWIWDDDNFQILIDPTPETMGQYYHIGITPIGTIFDQEIAEADPKRRFTKPSALGDKWSSEGQFATDIRQGFWSIETAIPFSSFANAKVEEGSIWKLNLYRVEQRRQEYTYWSPVHSRDQWPHVPQRFGEMILSGILTAEENFPRPPEPPAHPRPGSEKGPRVSLKIASIKIEGNKKISEQEILQTIGVKVGDRARFDLLSQVKSSLEALGWFESVGIDLSESEEGVDLVIKLVEQEIISISEVKITGNSVFKKEDIVRYFNLMPATVTAQDIQTKCNLIKELYRSKGYTMSYVKCSVDSDVLNIDIDEGRIDLIEISGNKRVSKDLIMKYLNLKPSFIYKENEINDAINVMKSRIPYFRSVTWEMRRTDTDTNVLHIEVREGEHVDFDVHGAPDFNRVHGLQIGFKSDVKSFYWGTKAHTYFAYGLSSGRWNYQLEIEKSFFINNKLYFGAGVHRITDTNDRELLTDTENFIAEAILGEGYRHYYQRQGYELSLAQGIGYDDPVKLGVRYRNDDYESLPKTNDWSILNRAYKDNVCKDKKCKPDNPMIDDGIMKSVTFELNVDTRNVRNMGAVHGWYNTFSIERAGSALGGDFEFYLYQANIRRYSRLSQNQFLFFRTKVATADVALPIQRKFYLGGIGTLRGHTFKAFDGDKMFLLNVEYWLTSLHGIGLNMFFFLDSGYTWDYREQVKFNDIKTDVGCGLGLGSLSSHSLIINIAIPISEKSAEPIVSFRMSRMF